MWQYISNQAKLFKKKVKGVEKFMFGCHTLTHGTKMRRLPHMSKNRNIIASHSLSERLADALLKSLLN